jgi:hypothetical protein
MKRKKHTTRQEDPEKAQIGINGERTALGIETEMPPNLFGGGIAVYSPAL